jgi:hypothetical protein
MSLNPSALYEKLKKSLTLLLNPKENKGNGLIKSKMLLRSVRATVAGKELTRKINPANSGKIQKKPENSGIQGFLKGLGGFISSAWGFVKSTVNFLGSLGQVWSAVSQGIVNLVYFDWNATDAAIDKAVQNNLNSASESAGEWFGYAVCGAVNVGASVLIPDIGKIVALAATKEFGEEVLEEMQSAIRVIMQKMASNILLLSYKGVRSWIKSFERFLPPGKAKTFLNKWGKGDEPWTIAGFIEKKIESLPDGMLKSFLEGTWEGCLEGFVEAGYIVGNEIDRARENQQQQIVEKEYAIEIRLDKRNKESNAGNARKEDRLLVIAPASQLKATVAATMNTRLILEDRDIGQWLGYPLEETEYKPRMQLRQLKITFTSKQFPPFRNMPDGSRTRRAEITIPDAKPNLKWNEIKNACRHYLRGNTLVTVLLQSGREMQVWASTPQEGVETLRELAKLSTSEIVPGTFRSETALELPTQKKKPIDKMYPNFGVLMYRKPKVDAKGQIDWDGKTYKEEFKRFNLFTEKEPEDFKPIP